MGVFEKVLQERQPASEQVAMTPRQAFAAIMVATFNADGSAAAEEGTRLHDIFNSTKLFRNASNESPQAVLERVLELFRVHGAGAIVALAAKVLPSNLRAPTFAIAVDLVLADGERTFIDGLQGLLQVPDEDAMKIVDVMLVKNSV